MHRFIPLLLPLLLLIGCEQSASLEHPQFCYSASVSEIDPHWVNYKDKYFDNETVLTVSMFTDDIDDIDYTWHYISQIDSIIGIDFQLVQSYSSTADIRISFDPRLGAYSYLGTDIYKIPEGKMTMNLGFRSTDGGTVKHELFHTLNFLHEHQNPNTTLDYNKPVVYADLGGPPNNWDQATIDHNVLNQKDPKEVDAGEFDSQTMMLYKQPCPWLNNPQPGVNCDTDNNHLSTLDTARAMAIYPPVDEAKWLFPDTTTIEPTVCPQVETEFLCELLAQCTGWRLSYDQLLTIAEAMDLADDYTPDDRYDYNKKQTLFLRINKEMSDRGCYTCFF